MATLCFNCPRCHSTNISLVSSDDKSLIDELLTPTALVSLGVSVCKTFKVHPVVGVVAGTALATVIQMSRDNKLLTLDTCSKYRCNQCSHVF